ncbi:MAG: cupin domain-containing protein [Acidobacteriota bacterium]
MPNRPRVLSVLLVAALLPAGSPAAEPDPKILTYTLPDKIDWKKTASSDTAILQGDPAKPGIYIELVRWKAGNTSRPHTHPTDRYITVISGTWWLGTGTEYDPASMFAVKAGTYVVHHANQPHYDGAKDEDCVIMIVGMGPATSTLAEK